MLIFFILINIIIKIIHVDILVIQNEIKSPIIM